MIGKKELLEDLKFCNQLMIRLLHYADKSYNDEHFWNRKNTVIQNDIIGLRRELNNVRKKAVTEKVSCELCVEKQRQLAEWLKDYKRLLKQKPCEDAVSRQAVLGLFAQNGDAVRPYSKTWEEVKTLPPVDPQQRVGHWISLGIQGEVDGQIVQVFTCSECGAISIFWMTNGNIVNGNICPNCGVKMTESQESECGKYEVLD